jgi:hypothetical protein
MKSKTNFIIIILTLMIIFGFQCNKDVIKTEPAKELFREKISLLPAKKTYNINDTIWLNFTTADKTLFDTLSNQRLSTNGLKFNFRAILLPLYNTPQNISNSFCKFILTSNVVPQYDTTKFNSMINFDIGCDTQPFYNIKLGLVLKYSGTYLLNLSDVGTKLQTCNNQINPYPTSNLTFTYNLSDCNKDVFLSIPPSERPEYPTGFRQAQIDAKISFAIKVQ